MNFITSDITNNINLYMEAVVPKLVRNYTLHNFFKKNITLREAVLYALGVGCNQNPMNKHELKFTYENHPDFEVIQSITSAFSVVDLEKIRNCPGLPKYDPMALLHGEQVITFSKPVLAGMNFKSHQIIEDIADKKSGALLTIKTTESLEDSNETITVNHCRLFIRGIGGFGDKGVLPAENFPKQKSDTVIEQVTYPTALNQAHLYRNASEDVNPLHVDPDQAERGGFKRPILHGLCTLGFSTRAYQSVFNTSKFSKIGVRFTAPTTPGQNLLIKFFETENNDVKIFETHAYDSTSSEDKAIVVAKGFFHQSASK